MAEDRRNPVLAEVEARAEVLAPHRYDLSSVAVARTLSPTASAAPPILKTTWTRSPLAGPTARSTESEGSPHHYSGGLASLETRAVLPPLSPGQTDHLCLAAAWILGAADLARTERGPLPAGSDPQDPAHGLTNAFGDHPYLYGGPTGTESPVLLESDPSEVTDLVRDAAEFGWVHWVFKPAAHNAFVLRHLRSLYPHDRSVLADGTRPPRDDLPTRPLAARAASRRTVYDLVARNG